MQKINNRTIRFAFYLALASTLFVIEQFIPKPMPFLRLGIANVFILILLSENEYLEAFGVSIGKSIVGSFFAGMLFSPTAILSLGSSFCSSIIMIILSKSSSKFSLFGISIIGSTIHNLTQLILVRFLVVRDDTIFRLTPLMLFLSLMTGLFTAYLAYKVKEKINWERNEKEKKDTE